MEPIRQNQNPTNHPTSRMSFLKANPEGAYFEGANLTNANIEGANFTRANLTNAIL